MKNVSKVEEHDDRLSFAGYSFLIALAVLLWYFTSYDTFVAIVESWAPLVIPFLAGCAFVDWRNSRT